MAAVDPPGPSRRVVGSARLQESGVLDRPAGGRRATDPDALPDGAEYVNVGTVQEAEAPKRLVFTIALLNRDGSRRLQNLTTVDLADRGEATEVTVQVRVLHATPDARDNLAGMRDGWSESLQKLSNAAEEGSSR